MSFEKPSSTTDRTLSSREKSRSNLVRLRTKLGRIAVTCLAVVGGAMAITTVKEVAYPQTAKADSLGYPWPTDNEAQCQFGQSGGSSCINPAKGMNWDRYDWGIFDGSGVFHAYREADGYEYRNCTDYVAWKLETLGISSSKVNGLHNGGQWYDYAPSSMQSKTPKAWDAAVIPGNPGHVAFIESVNSIDPNNALNDNITISEYNHDAQGHGDVRTGTAASMGFTEFVDFGIHPASSITGGNGPNFIPAMVQRPSGETDVAVVGPANALDFYFNPPQTTTWGKIAVPNAQAFSTPDMLQRPQTGEVDIAAQGAGNSLYYYFNPQGSTSWGKLGVAAPGWAFSAPAMVQRPSGEVDIAVQGPGNSLDYYFSAPGSPYWTRMPVAGANTTYSPPKMIQRPSGETDIVAQGPSNSLLYYFNAQGSGAWGKLTIAGSGSAYSAPAIVQRPDSGETDVAVQGPSNSLDFYINRAGTSTWGKIAVAGANTTYNSPNPPAMLQRPDGETDIAVQGPGNQADFFFNAQNSSIWGESIAAVNSYSLRAPVMVQRPSNGETDVAIVGPSNRLDYYFNSRNSPNWPNMPIAGNNSAS
jgi:surface antigen